jgi:probable phosphoglycerate mutase
MRLFLVRHGETVDNVAGLYAGSRDSALTAHGVLQIQRLAAHLADAVFVTHVFSSNLQRAARTAEAVQAAQAALRPADDGLAVVQLPELREKHFGSGEGVKFGAAARGEEKVHVGAETAEQMRARVIRFVDHHLAPLWASPSTGMTPCVVVAAHGIILGVLFRVLTSRIPKDAITMAPDAQAGLYPSWSNTGYLEVVLTPPGSPSAGPALPYRLHVEHVNYVVHLKGLKKTRGGIGSAAHDDRQRTIDSFFGAAAKRKLDDATK